MVSRSDIAKALAALSSLRFFARRPALSLSLLSKTPQAVRGLHYGQCYRDKHAAGLNAEQLANCSPILENVNNPIRRFFESKQSGRGIWKWDHYLDIYHNHLRKFIGREVHILEIGIYSGGSLELWREYFGSKCHVYGIDIEESCRVYQDDRTQIFIGDQEDRNFWRTFRQSAPLIDIVIDDGGHSSEQQIVTLEEMLPHVRPGGVYMCEDVHGTLKGFNSFTQGLFSNLNAMNFKDPTLDSAGGVTATEFQAWIQSMHFYPYLTVIEKSDSPVQTFVSRRKGTEWQPFEIPGGVTATQPLVREPQECQPS